MRERQLDVEPLVEVLPDQATPTEREEERDATDDRRQHHRQRAQRPHRARARGTALAPAPTPAARRTRARRAVAHSEHQIDSRSAVSTLSEREDRPRVGPRRPPQQPDERQGEERDGDRGEDEGRTGGRRPARRVARRRPGGWAPPTLTALGEPDVGEDRLSLVAEHEGDERLGRPQVLGRR